MAEEVLHRIRVFVFEQAETSPQYLLLRPAQGLDACWGPIHGSIGFGEKLETAIRREVTKEAGLARSLDLIDLDLQSHWLVGDEQVIEWNFGVRAPSSDSVHPDEHWAEFRWANFSDAYPSLELEYDRAAIMRLHTLLGAA